MQTTAEFWSKVDRSAGPSGCWPWLGDTYRNGYGRCTVSPGRQGNTHRQAWRLANGREIPDGLYVCHTCDHPRCVNPAHLFVGTPKANSEDRDRKGRRAPHPGPRHTCSAGHPVDVTTKRFWTGTRCAECHDRRRVLANARWRERHAAPSRPDLSPAVPC